MPHIHEKIDFTASAYIIFEDKILLQHHKLLDSWMQIGGHVELDEGTDEALFREIKEECGLEVEVLSKRVGTDFGVARPLLIPHFMNIHHVDDEGKHRHIDLGFVCRAKSMECRLEERAAHDIGWFTKQELEELDMFDNVREYSLMALEIAKTV